ncbi:MAG TPA: radical SAM protein, partial [Thermodesulfobacteriota bacterium]|nr:radical SAM protein [Thermodesulfobacteriota bacterium]
MILIHPPVSRPCEPPAGIARLSAALHSSEISCRLLDANIEALLWLLRHPGNGDDTWTRRATAKLPAHLKEMRAWQGYGNFSRYRRAVSDLNRVLEKSAWGRATVGPANYQDPSLSPLRSADLIRSAESPEESPFYPYFRERLPAVPGIDGIVGFSLNFLTQALPGFAMIGFLKKRFPRVKIIAGGGLVTSWVRRPGWKNPFLPWIDVLVAGPGEDALISLLGREPGAAPSPPRYEGFPLAEYFAPGFILPYSASTGCYWNRCRFCPERAEGNPYRPVPPLQVAREIETLVARQRPVLLHFLDNAVSPALLEELARRPPGVPWYGFVRITDSLADLDFCLALKKSGCVLLQIGLESGNEKVLDALQKGIRLETAGRVLRNLKHAGIAAYVYLLFG